GLGPPSPPPGRQPQPPTRSASEDTLEQGALVGRAVEPRHHLERLLTRVDPGRPGASSFARRSRYGSATPSSRGSSGSRVTQVNLRDGRRTGCWPVTFSASRPCGYV